MKHILKWPLIVAAMVVVLRVVAERAGVPNSISSLLSVVALHLVLGPLYFAICIGRSGTGGIGRQFAFLLKLVAQYVVLTRVMILPTYWLAHIYHWTQPRFGGLSGPDVTPFRAYVAIPFGTAAIWIVISLVVGSALGAVVITAMAWAARKK